jgi:hypothetical protein
LSGGNFRTAQRRSRKISVAKQKPAHRWAGVFLSLSDEPCGNLTIHSFAGGFVMAGVLFDQQVTAIAVLCRDTGAATPREWVHY